MKLIERKNYLQKMIESKDVPEIKVITGIKSCGKSKLLDAFNEYLETLEDTNIIRINLELRKFKDLLVPDGLYDYTQNSYVSNKENQLAYLKGVFETTIIKDIITKYKIENEQLLDMQV